MKIMFVLLFGLGICTSGLAQDNAYYPNVPAVIYVFHTQNGVLVYDTYPPADIDPYAVMTINPAFLMNFDGSGPNVLDPKAKKRMNPYLLFVQDYIDPGQSPVKRRNINTNYINPCDSYGPIVPNTRLKTAINPAFGTVHY